MNALAAEWTKLRTVSGPAWLLAAAVAMTVAVALAADAATRCPVDLACHVDTAKLTLTGVQISQAIVAILAVLMISGEYSTGMIRVTFAAMPRRPAVLAAKAALLAGLVLAAGTVGVFASVLVGRELLPGHGFTAARGYLALSLGDGPVLRAAVGSVLYLALVGVMSLGIAAFVRDSAGAIGLALGVIYVFPIVLAFIGNPTWQHRLERYTPTNAGLTIQATTGLRHLPISPWMGLGVLAIWAAAALLAGGAMLRLRDA
jgi:ABC-2 type transport system permease protein